MNGNERCGVTPCSSNAAVAREAEDWARQTGSALEKLPLSTVHMKKPNF